MSRALNPGSEMKAAGQTHLAAIMVGEWSRVTTS